MAVRNKITGETLTHKQHGYCPVCGINFTGWSAFDKHRFGPHSPESATAPVGLRRVCLTPQEVGLRPSTTKHGAVVWSK